MAVFFVIIDMNCVFTLSHVHSLCCGDNVDSQNQTCSRHGTCTVRYRRLCYLVCLESVQGLYLVVQQDVMFITPPCGWTPDIAMVIALAVVLGSTL